MPVAAPHHPQQIICGRRFVLGKGRRTRAIHAQASAHTALMSVHAAAGLLQPTGAQFVHQAATYLGFPYCAYGCRCEVTCYCHDCSGLCDVCLNVLIPTQHICTSSFGFAQIAVQQDLIVDRDYALHHAGCLAIENPFGTSNGSGSNGHIVVMTAGIDGSPQDGTIEEMGTREGCVRSTNDGGRGLDFYMKPPGINTNPQPIPVPTKVDPMLFFDLKHPSKANRTRSASIDAAGNIRLGNGAKLVNQTPKTIFGVRVVVPPSGGAPYMGATHAADGGFTMQFLQKDGSYADFHFAFAQ